MVRIVASLDVIVTVVLERTLHIPDEEREIVTFVYINPSLILEIQISLR